jgi:glutaryl-CoA dehydrogenase
VLTGHKRWIGLGTHAGLIVVWARDTSTGQVGAFVVERGSPGYQACPIEGKASLRSIWQADITLDHVRVPAEYRLPGARSFKDAGRVLAATRRHQFGQPLASFQIQQRLVGMLADLTAMQLYCMQIAGISAFT